MEFRIGDRVRCTGGHWYYDVEGLIGTIVIEGLSYDEVGIKFDEKVLYGKGHDLRGLLSEEYKKHGYYIATDDLEMVKKSNKEAYM